MTAEDQTKAPQKATEDNAEKNQLLNPTTEEELNNHRVGENRRLFRKK